MFNSCLVIWCMRLEMSQPLITAGKGSRFFSKEDAKKMLILTKSRRREGPMTQHSISWHVSWHGSGLRLNHDLNRMRRGLPVIGGKEIQCPPRSHQPTLLIPHTHRPHLLAANATCGPYGERPGSIAWFEFENRL